ncbi:MAG: LysR family transcriptional regulator [Calditrichaeota bacterium]|nr:MAG: LysR family transcriptional regulator [Calditrichota bacterium]
MQIRTLKTFCDVVELHSFSEAAKVNHLTQSAVSQQISHIESEYGVRMIERAQRNLTLTPAGEVFYQACKDVLQRLEDVRLDISELSNLVAGTIKLESIYTIGLHDLPRYVKEFMSAFPDVQIHLTYRHSAEIYQDILSNMAHLGVVAQPQKNRQLDIYPCWKEKLVVIAPPSHRFAGKTAIPIAELDKEPFIAFERNIPTRKLIDKTFRPHQVQPHIVMTLDNIETIKRVVENGTGISIVPKNSIHQELEDGTLVAIDILDVPLEREIAVISKKGRILSNAERKFIDLLEGKLKLEKQNSKMAVAG